MSTSGHYNWTLWTNFLHLRYKHKLSAQGTWKDNSILKHTTCTLKKIEHIATNHKRWSSQPYWSKGLAETDTEVKLHKSTVVQDFFLWPTREDHEQS